MKKLVLLIFTILVACNIQSQVAINTDGSVADNAAILDVKSTDKGLLIPRMTSSQRDAISSPVQGLMIFTTTDSTFYFYQGNSWRKLGVGASGWDCSDNNIFTDSLQSISIGDTAGDATFQVITDIATDTYTVDQCSGGTSSASESYAGKPASNAFDDNNTTYWSNDNSLPAWLQYDMGVGNGKVIEKYRIYFESSNYDASPKDWTFEASEDASLWVTLDTISNENWSTNEWKEYSISNSNRYRYYRINISDNKGSTDNYVSINEMEMQEMIYQKYPTLVVIDNKVGIGTSTPTATLEVNGRISQIGIGQLIFFGRDAGLNNKNSSARNVYIGYECGKTSNTGYYNTAIGYQSLFNNVSGYYNSAIGYQSLYNNTSGYNNNAIGNMALYSNNGVNNVAIGTLALGSNISGGDNNALGINALYYNSTGSGNTAFGSFCLYINSTGDYNTALGCESMFYNSSGNSNIAIGASTLYSSGSISNLIAIGDSALYNNGIGATGGEGKNNTAVGSKSMFFNTKGSENTAFGFNSLFNNTTASGITALGCRAAFNNTTGSNNTAVGDSCLYSNTTGSNNVAIGSLSLSNCTSGDNNTVVGSHALSSNTLGNNNCAFGTESLFTNSAGSNNTALGQLTLYSNTAGDDNTAIGSFSLTSNTSGLKNTAVGYESLNSNQTGSENSCLGYGALYSNEGSYNVGFGINALHQNTTGDANVSVGPNTLFNNTTGGSNTAIGNWAGPTSGSTSLSNTTALGNYTSVTSSNTIHFGNSSITEIAGQVAWSTYSDKRFKKNIKENIHGLDFIMKLKPVTYNWDIVKLDKFWGIDEKINKNADAQESRERSQKITYTGFLAQEVEEAAQEIGYDFSGVVHPQNGNSIYSVRYAEFVVPLVKAVQEQQKMIEELKNEIELLKKLSIK